MTSDYIIALIELSLNVGNDEYIVQCNFGGHSTSGVEVIEGGRLKPPPPLPGIAGSEKQHGLNRVK